MFTTRQVYIYIYIYSYTDTCILYSTHTHTHTHTHIYIYIYIHMRAYTRKHRYNTMHTFMHTYMHICIHGHIHRYIHACRHEYIHTCIHPYKYIYIYICIYAYICLQYWKQKHPNTNCNTTTASHSWISGEHQRTKEEGILYFSGFMFKHSLQITHSIVITFLESFSWQVIHM